MCTMLRYLYIADITKRFPAQIAFMIRIKSKVTLFSSLFSCLQAINLRRQDRLSNKKKRSSPPNGFRVSSVDKISKVFWVLQKSESPSAFSFQKLMVLHTKERTTLFQPSGESDKWMSWVAPKLSKSERCFLKTNEKICYVRYNDQLLASCIISIVSQCTF